MRHVGREGLMLLACLVVAVSSARAQPAGAQAEALFQQGRDLMEHGKVAEACDAFEASQKLEAATSTLLNLADCRAKNGQLATAWGFFLQAARETRSAKDDLSREFNKVATEHAQALEQRVSHLTVAVADERRISGLEILRGDVVVDPGMWNRALPLDGGSYTVTARAPGRTTWSTRVVIAAESDSKTIEVPALQPTTGHAAKDGGTPNLGPPRSPPAVETSKPPAGDHAKAPVGKRSKRLPLAIGAGALVCAGAALGFELWAESVYDDAKREPDHDKQDSLWNGANTRRYIADGFLGAGLAAAGLSAWLFVRDRRDGTVVTGAVDGSHAGLLVFGTF